MGEALALYREILQGNDVHKNLIKLRSCISDEKQRRDLMYGIGGDFDDLFRLLSDPDPKVRKSAALILGETENEDALPALIEAWQKEQTLYIREDYLKAISKLDYSEYLPTFRRRVSELYEELAAENPTAENPMGERETETASHLSEAPGTESRESALWDNNKHLYAEIRILSEMLRKMEKHQRHRFVQRDPAPDLILICSRAQTSVTMDQISSGTKKLMTGGVRVRAGSFDEILRIRTWTECLFPIPGAHPISGDEKMLAQKLHELKIGAYLSYLHEDRSHNVPENAEEGQGGKKTDCFFYRIELKDMKMDRQKKGVFIRRIASRLDELERGKLQNAESEYEAEIRLILRQDGSYMPMLKLFTIGDRRFIYRRMSISQGMSPTTAALAVEIARPFLKAGAQILDPFCGTGTLLIERNLAVHADPIYGIDHYEDAIKAAKANTQALRDAFSKGWKMSARLSEGERLNTDIHYINRSFFDFTHDYLFDEIITELPTVEETFRSEFYRSFLNRSANLLKEGAVLIVLAVNPGLLCEEARKSALFRMEKRAILNERSDIGEVIFSFQKREL